MSEKALMLTRNDIIEMDSFYDNEKGMKLAWKGCGWEIKLSLESFLDRDVEFYLKLRHLLVIQATHFSVLMDKDV